MGQRIAPYGTWHSPLSPERLVEQAVRFSQLETFRGTLYWVEGRPAEGGRNVIVRARPGDPPRDVLPAGFDARTAVHEYGGRCYALHRGELVFSNWEDQRLWILPEGGEPAPITPEPPESRAWRYADPVFTPDGAWVVCVRECHGPGGVVNDLVVLPRAGGQPRVLASGHDFFSAPRFSPDGRRLAWLSWDLPAMPWDCSTLWVAEFSRGGLAGPPVEVAGGSEESVTQPRWSPEGVLHYVSDRSGWWNLYDEHGRPLAPIQGEFGRPDWVFGAATYGFLENGTVVAAWDAEGFSHLGTVARGRVEEITCGFSYLSSLVAMDDRVAVVGAGPAVAPAVATVDLNGKVEVLRQSQELLLEADSVSTPRHYSFPTGDGQEAHLLLYPPRSTSFMGPPGERPPVVVCLHGGPTGAAVPAFDPAVQYWTTRGFAVADVNYRGSSGYGRRYRQALKGLWGVADVADCARAVAWLDSAGLADGRRAVVRGASAGGFSALAALAFTDAFAGGASLYGVADLSLLARETHKFESRYLDSLVGPWPNAEDELRRRSPIHHVERITRPLVLFQGTEDKVVPPEQSRMMYEALRRQGREVEYYEFDGEGHGFRKARTLIEVARRELSFYERVLGL